MANSTDMKSKNRHSNIDTHLDALLDEAELSLGSPDSDQADEDAIDRLLVDTGFDADEELPPLVDDTVFPAKFDQFGDDFDLADISTETRNFDARVNPGDELKADHDFPLELLDPLTIMPDEEQNAFIAAGENDDLPIAPSLALPDDETEKAAEEVSVLDYNSLTSKLDEFSDFDEFNDFQDFQQPEIIAADDVDPSLSSETGLSEHNETITPRTTAVSNEVMPNPKAA